jgi:flagellar biosynthesis GTPase FlhF
MQTKTYFASSVPAALEVARKELGEDAMLVTSKPASAEARPFGRLEVTFAYDPKPAAPMGAMPGAIPGAMPGGMPGAMPGARLAVFPVVNRVSESSRPARSVPSHGSPQLEPRSLVLELDEIRGQISALKQAVVRPAAPILVPMHLPMHESRSTVAAQLCESGLGRDIAEEIALAVQANGSPEAVSKELAARIPVAAFPELKPGETRTVALVGPSGRGKTTTLVKIAVRYGLANRVPVKIYTAGSHGVGCEDRMARYASILGVPFHACESLESLGLALAGETWKGLVLIDTPGISPGEIGEIQDFARFFKRRPEIEKHLVLRADTRSADIAHVMMRFGAMEVSRLLFTGLDEAVSLGSMADAAIRSHIPVALTGTGQRIPEDLETASAGRLIRGLAGESASAAAAA